MHVTGMYKVYTAGRELPKKFDPAHSDIQILLTNVVITNFKFSTTAQ
jgi:hypothetical protein